MTTEARVEFTAHNIRLDDGTYTKPDMQQKMESHPWFLAAQRLLNALFPDDKSGLRLADLGCLEGGYSVEFARMGFETLGLEIRESNLAACRYMQERTKLPNLRFVQDNALNIGEYGTFDAIFCCGLLYHLDKPKAFIETLSACTSRVLILQTHFSIAGESIYEKLPRRVRKVVAPNAPETSTTKYHLSPIAENEGVRGRWYTEFYDEAQHKGREGARWASWDNYKSFWMQREYLLQTLYDAGFPVVLEQFDGLGSNIVQEMTEGFYGTDGRGTFVGIKPPA